MKNIYKKCTKCVDGLERVEATDPDGGLESTTITCRTCGGATKVPDDSFLSDDFIDKINDMDNKLDDIIERLTE